MLFAPKEQGSIFTDLSIVIGLIAIVFLCILELISLIKTGKFRKGT